ncbi:MAG: S8 family serine peptidase [Pyrinomonadaceae bacterium]
MKINNYRRALVVLAVLFVLGVSLALVFNRSQAGEGKTDESVFQKFENRDLITDLIRNPEKEFFLVKVRDIGDRAAADGFGTTIEDYGTLLLMARNKGSEVRSRERLEIRRVDFNVNLPFGKFEPLLEPVPETVKADGTGLESFSGKDYYIVQFGGITKQEWLDSLKEIGVEIVQYVPHQAFLVYSDAETIKKVAGHSRVRWVGRYSSRQKISPFTKDFSDNLGGKTAEFDVAVFSRADLNDVLGEISEKTGSRVSVVEKTPSNFLNLLKVRLSASDLEKVAGMKDVIRIDPFVKPEKEDERAAQIVAGNYINSTTLNPPGYDPLTQFGVDGTNVTVAVVDDGVSIPGNGGFYLTSNNTVNGPLRSASAGAEGGHGHLNASIIAGSAPFGVLDPTSYNYGQGIAPKANIINIPFLVSGNTTTDSQSVDDSLNTMGPNGVAGSITNNSWGAGTNGNAYDSRAALWDGLVQDASLASSIDPINIVFSAGNSGTSGLTRPKMAKNIIAVANSENIRNEFGGTNANNINDLRASSSRGPAADGRIKPDITAPGTYITGSRAGSCGSVTNCFDANHAYSIGTSHAAPQIAGVAALFTQFWKNNNGGNKPSPALVKAAILNSGQEINGVGSSSPIPNGDEGWGLVNMKFIFNTGVPIKYIDQTVEFSDPGNNTQITGTVGDGSKPVRVTLVWTDPPAVSDPTLINNLDLTVTIGGNVYRGNVFSGGVSQTGGAADSVNNIENVFLPAGTPAGTPFTIEISASALNGNGILGNVDSTDQNFALVAYNFNDQAVAAGTAFDYDGDNKTDISIFRPSVGQWWIQRSSTSITSVDTFGTSSDTLVPADYTGDGKTDIAFWRPSTGEWFVLRSEDSSFFSFPFGASTDIPAPGDFDGDGRDDPAIFRPSTGTWFILASTQGTRIEQFGASGDVPVVGDYDGDGQADKAIYRVGSGQWWLDRSSAGLIVANFGTSTDRTVQGDYTGDGKTDVAFWRPSTGEWFVLRSEDSSFFSFPFGAGTDAPVPGDYDGDGRTDAGVYRPVGNTWFINASQSGQIIQSFGAAGDIPTPNVFVR